MDTVNSESIEVTTFETDLLSLRKELAQEKMLTASIREAAASEIERLQTLLAAESGNYVSTVYQMEERVNILTEKVSRMREALEVIYQSYCNLKLAYSRLEASLSDMQTKQTDIRLTLVKLVDRISFITARKQEVVDRIDDLDSRLTQAKSTIPSINLLGAIDYNEITARTETMSTRLKGVEQQVLSLENRLVSAFMLLATRYMQPVKCASRIQTLPSLATMDDCNTPSIDGCDSDTDQLISGSQPRSPQLQPADQFASTSSEENKDTPEKSTINAQSYKSSSSIQDQKTSRTSLHGFPHPRVPRFCRRQKALATEELKPSNPVVLCRAESLLHIPSSELVSVNGPTNLVSSSVTRAQTMVVASHTKEPKLNGESLQQDNPLSNHNHKVSKFGRAFKSIKRTTSERN